MATACPNNTDSNGKLATPPISDKATGRLVELVIERRVKAVNDGLLYDPWLDLARRKGVELTFHNPGKVAHFDDPRGVTNFNTLDVTLRYGLMEVQTRCTLAHELAHLDRGPRPKGVREAIDENRTDRLAAQRLIDPVVFAAVLDAFGPSPRKYAVHEFLKVDMMAFATYADWRRRARAETAERVFDEVRTSPMWPAPWMERELHRWPLLASDAGAAVQA